MKKIYFLSILLPTIFFSQSTQTRDDAGAYGEGINSGFYQALNPINFPEGATSWWHLLDVRHTNVANNYAMQFSGSFEDQNLWFRKTSNNGSQPWSKVVTENANGHVILGMNSINGKVAIGAESVHPLYSLYVNGDARFGDITMGGSNSWILHSPDDTRSTLSIAYKVKDAWDWDWNKAFIIDGKTGNVKVANKLEAKEIKVTTSPTADFVFEESYKLPKLEDIEKHIKEKKHLPEIASAKEMEKEGVNIGEFQIKLLQKIEELTLYSIDQNKQIQELKKEAAK